MRSTLSLGLVSGLLGHFTKCIILFERSDHRRIDTPHHFANLLSGAILGIPMVHFMKNTGKNEHISKGASFGMILWALSNATKSQHSFHHFRLHNHHDHHQKNRSELRTFVSFILYGVTTACAAKKLSDPGTYPDDEYDFGF